MVSIGVVVLHDLLSDVKVGQLPPMKGTLCGSVGTMVVAVPPIRRVQCQQPHCCSRLLTEEMYKYMLKMLADITLSCQNCQLWVQLTILIIKKLKQNKTKKIIKLVQLFKRIWIIYVKIVDWTKMSWTF